MSFILNSKENVVAELENNSLTACGIVNGNVDSDTFNIWLENVIVKITSDRHYKI